MNPEEKKCDCVQRLDKLRMDVEGGKDVAFACFVISRKEGAIEDVDPILHDLRDLDFHIILGEAIAWDMNRRLKDKD